MKMSRFVPYLGAVAAIIVVVFVASIPSSTTVSNIPVNIAVVPVATSTHADVNSAEENLTQIFPVTEKSATPEIALPQESEVPSLQTTFSPISAITSLLDQTALDSSASALRGALVNIICTVPSGTVLHSISGSGVFVDSKGIILTNAHVAQYFLLADRGASCSIRSGSPAVDNYEAELIYISPNWLRANSKVISTTAPSGTGEYDFAFLAVTKSYRNTSFPHIPLAINPSLPGTPVVIASYGAQFLESSQVRNSLSPIVVFGSVKDVFTFGTNTIDVFALGGSAAAQEGSSGGGVSDSSGYLVGTITTSSTSGTTDTRSLGAITASYIRAAYASETGEALDLLLSTPTETSINNFAPKIPTLESIITADLP